MQLEWSEMPEGVRCEEIDGVAVVRLQRPEMLNALNPEMLHELVATLDGITRESDVGTIVLTGGPQAFTTGEDLHRAAEMDPEGFRSQINEFQRLATLLRYSPKPTIAAIGGFAYGGGLEIAVNCDARVAARNARFACPEVEWGLTLTNGSSVLLRQLIGDGWARELLLFGHVVDAAQALEIGLVTRLVDADQLEEEAMRMARAAASYSAAAQKLTKELLNDELPSWDRVLQAETDAVMEGFLSGEVRQRLEAFATRKDRQAAQ